MAKERFVIGKLRLEERFGIDRHELFKDRLGGLDIPPPHRKTRGEPLQGQVIRINRHSFREERVAEVATFILKFNERQIENTVAELPVLGLDIPQSRYSSRPGLGGGSRVARKPQTFTEVPPTIKVVRV